MTRGHMIRASVVRNPVCTPRVLRCSERFESTDRPGIAQQEKDLLRPSCGCVSSRLVTSSTPAAPVHHLPSRQTCWIHKTAVALRMLRGTRYEKITDGVTAEPRFNLTSLY